jgi:5-methyltetrahydrofolate--homocysteine methyltransferase
MKKAVSRLAPYIELESEGAEKKTAGKVLLATVKGDVHDIGKNIVGVVLSCNNYEIIDLGVMVPAEKIIDTAIKEKVDLIGLSGLITPSLEEMVHVASEMERRKITIPLLIGGATTSEIHTAVKVEPAYSNAVIHVKDASKAAGVLSALLQKDNSSYVASIKAKYKKMRDDHNAHKVEKNLLTLDAARKNRFITDWKTLKLYEPVEPGLHVLHDIDLNVLRDYIDWTYFFFAWKISGKYPAIFDDPVKGVEAKKIFDDAQVYLKKIIDQKILTAKAVFELSPAAASGDDVKIFTDNTRKDVKSVFRFLRNQEPKEKGVPNLSLADYIAPEETGLKDWIGAFVVTADIDKEVFEKYKEDDYATIMIRILSDRLAEAAAEWLHERIRRQYWGYAKNENLSVDDVLRLRYKGIRPAPGYPACPDHTEKQIIFDTLGAEKAIGARLTENFAMIPPASVSGYIFAHPGSTYFNLGKIGTDQLKDYAKRKNFTNEETAKWLSPNL